MPIIAQPLETTQNFLLACPHRVDFSRELAQAKKGDPGSTSRRRAASARHLVCVLKRLHRHTAGCPACLLSEALGGAQ
jgi:hypothetical protein